MSKQIRISGSIQFDIVVPSHEEDRARPYLERYDRINLNDLAEELIAEEQATGRWDGGNIEVDDIYECEPPAKEGQT